MKKLIRNPDSAQSDNFDLIIIGGGIHGVMLTYEAARCGLKPLLLEMADFGGATSFNSLRIIHGGFRYLQNLDYFRLKESADERRWFLKNFPDLTKPLSCMIPLYGKGLRRSSTLSCALLLYNLITKNRNIGINSDLHIPPGRVISPVEVKSLFPHVYTPGLEGGAVWYDAFVEDTPMLIIEVLKRACVFGATVLNYFKASDLFVENNKVTGVEAIDVETSNKYVFKSSKVVNNTGPWCRDLATVFDRDEPALFRSMLAWNILFDREAISNHGVAVKSERSSHTYFIVPWKGRLLIGTGHAPWSSESRIPEPSQAQINEFITDINYAIPGLGLNFKDILYVMPGLQSATQVGGKNLAKREQIIDHGRRQGPRGLYSVSGIKFTTARLVAEKTLKRAFPGLSNKKTTSGHDHFIEQSQDGVVSLNLEFNDETIKNNLKKIIDSGSVIHLGDLVFRRSTLWEKPDNVISSIYKISKAFNWDTERQKKEIYTLSKLFKNKTTVL